MWDISYTVTPESWRQAAEARYDALSTRWRRLVFAVVGLLLLVVSSVALARLGQIADPAVVKMLLPLLLLQFAFGLLLFCHRWLTVAIHRLAGRRHPNMGKDLRYTLSAEGIAGEPLGTAQVYPWQAFQNGKSRVVAQGIILIHASGVCHWLPATAFASTQDWQGAAALAENKLRFSKRNPL
jgi:hypothetical protein